MWASRACQAVLTVAEGSLGLALSPDLAQDGLAFALADGQPHSSRDAGATWAPLDPATGQRIESLAFSPAVAHDRTIFLGTSDTRLTDRPREPGDPEQSRGVLISNDGGVSWGALPNQPAIDGVPYRRVAYLAGSPTFADGGTLIAFAWGPSRPSETAGVPPRPDGALFVSRDRGGSWASVYRTGAPTSVLATFSPNFAADGTMLLARTSNPLVALSPGSQTCNVMRSTDRGATWSETFFAHDTTCFGLHLRPRGDRLIGLLEGGGVRSGYTRLGSMVAGVPGTSGCRLRRGRAGT